MSKIKELESRVSRLLKPIHGFPKACRDVILKWSGCDSECRIWRFYYALNAPEEYLQEILFTMLELDWKDPSSTKRIQMINRSEVLPGYEILDFDKFMNDFLIYRNSLLRSILDISFKILKQSKITK
jgi:hypothetical protein